MRCEAVAKRNTAQFDLRNDVAGKVLFGAHGIWIVQDDDDGVLSTKKKELPIKKIWKWWIPVRMLMHIKERSCRIFELRVGRGSLVAR